MKFKGTLMNLDGKPDSAGDIFPIDCNVKIKNPITVTKDFKQTPEGYLGKGKITRTKNRLMYEIEINTKKLPKGFYKYLTPAVGGHILNREGKKITEIAVGQIGLSISGNTDPRIKPLKKP